MKGHNLVFRDHRNHHSGTSTFARRSRQTAKCGSTPIKKRVHLDVLGDDAGMMAFCFVNEQMEFKCICVLIDNYVGLKNFKIVSHWSFSPILSAPFWFTLLS